MKRLVKRFVLDGVCLAVFVVGSLARPGVLAHDLVDYDIDVQPIFSASCGGAGCHIEEAASGVDLTSYESLMSSVGELYQSRPVVPGDPQGSPLYLKLIESPALKGEIMPPNGPLSAVFVRTIESWIEEGARPSEQELTRGDANDDEAINLTDAVSILLFLFSAGEPPVCEAVADVDTNGTVNLSDSIALLSFLFSGGDEPAPLSHAEEDACRGGSPELSFQSIQEKIFSRSCASASCHSADGSKAGLVLENLDLSYANLVGTPPNNAAARETGLLRVDPGRPENSFLLKKLIRPDIGEGNRMPLAARALSDDKIQAIREWINARAPKEGTISGVPDIGDTAVPPPDRMQPPPVPENGIQIHLEPFQIAPRTEREIFKLVDPGLTADVIVKRFDIYMTENSHHFILYTWNNRANPPPLGFRDVRSTTGVGAGSRTGLVGSQTSFHTREFPEGYGIRVRRGTLFDLNSHYLNLDGREVLLGEVYVNLFFAPPESVDKEIRSLLFGTLDLLIPPGETRTVSSDWPSRSGVTRQTEVHVLSSHMHRHGVHFTATWVKRDGSQEQVYENFDWDDPEERVFSPPLIMERGDWLHFTCTHTNHDRNVPLRFGLTSEDEMCFITGWVSD